MLREVFVRADIKGIKIDVTERFKVRRRPLLNASCACCHLVSSKPPWPTTYPRRLSIGISRYSGPQDCERAGREFCDASRKQSGIVFDSMSLFGKSELCLPACMP